MSNSTAPFERFAADIEGSYGITPNEITVAPRGFAAETYYVDTENRSFFLKIMNTPGRQDIFTNGLKVLNALVLQGVDFVPRVIPTVDGKLYFKKGDSVLALLTRIDGKQTYSFDKRDAFKKLTQIYRASESFPEKGSFMKENFSDWFIEAYQNQIHSFLHENIKGDEAQEVKELLMPYRQFLESCTVTAKTLVSKCREQQPTFYLTHSDFPGNIMVSEDGHQYIIDFDEAVFGPLERDGWLCLARQDEESELWLSVIREAFPDYIVNQAFIHFYIYQRFMIDLWDFINQVLHNPDTEYRKRIVNSTKDYLLGWLYPLMLKNV